MRVIGVRDNWAALDDGRYVMVDGASLGIGKLIEPVLPADAIFDQE